MKYMIFRIFICIIHLLRSNHRIFRIPFRLKFHNSCTTAMINHVFNDWLWKTVTLVRPSLYGLWYPDKWKLFPYRPSQCWPCMIIHCRIIKSADVPLSLSFPRWQFSLLWYKLSALNPRYQQQFFAELPSSGQSKNTEYERTKDRFVT